MVIERRETPSLEVKVESLAEPQSVETAVEHILQGGVLVVQLRKIFGMVFDAESPEATRKVSEVKKANPERKFATMMSAKAFLPLIDREAVAESLRPLVQDPQILKTTIGGICHLRAPIKKERAKEINGRAPNIVSFKEGRYYIYNLIPFGHAEITRLANKLNEKGVVFPGVTSLNQSQEPEIIGLKEAQAFCRQHSALLPFILTDSNSVRRGVKGSYTIIDLAKLTVERNGNVPASLLAKILGTNLDSRNARGPKHEQADFGPVEDLILELNLGPIASRAAVLLYIKGKAPEEIKSRLQKAMKNSPDFFTSPEES